MNLQTLSLIKHSNLIFYTKQRLTTNFSGIFVAKKRIHQHWQSTDKSNTNIAMVRVGSFIF